MPAPPAPIAPRDISLVLLVILLWGINFVPTKYALEDFSPLQLGALRFLLVAFPLIFWVPFPKAPVSRVVLFAFSQGIGQFGLLFFALQVGMTAALASVLMQTQMFFTALLGVFVLGESITRTLMLSMAVAALGLCCFATEVALRGDAGGTATLGFALTLCAALMWSTSNIVIKRIQASWPACTPASLLVWSSLVSGLVFSALSLVTGDTALDTGQLTTVSASTWLSMLYVGWIAGGLAFWLWTTLLTRYAASQIAPFSLGVPAVGLFAGIVVLGEQVTLLQWLGSALVMTALVVVVVSARLKARKYLRSPVPD